ncbi:ribosomal-protein-alanine acetyltransferase [Agromyces terreus]|uniref:Ribosomal-protein-alanine acetyltransferase n=1 Tax=Agromyces terreus TaxID=424795 RepID=A0A9X2H818_9MICO|nr:ribosomal protein S18-alanine N-acetyltransferase [Agromyces terreus]MCP2371159.1 ribosomal-protein-alanine acetyltransferase [Agromyces terreus]
MSVLMRRARLDDLEPIMALERATFANDAWSEAMMRAEIEGEHGYYLVAVDDEADDAGERLMGYAGLYAPAGTGDADVQTIAVAPATRGIGLGRGFMHALITHARRIHVARVFLEVRADNPIAKSLYDSLGFVEIGVRKGYYQPDGVDAIAMRLDVPEAVTRPASPTPQSRRPAPGTATTPARGIRSSTPGGAA